MAIALILAAGLALQASAVPPATPPAAPLNLVVLDLATLSPGRLKPGFDFMTSSGAVFDAAIAQADRPAPSLASILTSEYAAAHGVLGAEAGLSTSALLLPEILARAGYRTALFEAGKPPAPDLERGFEDRHAAETFGSAADESRRWLARRPKEPFFLFVRGGGASDAAAVRALWEDLARGGLLSRTVVMLIAENGPRGPGVLADGVLRVPLVVWAPGVRPHRVGRIVSAIDAAPTALALMGLPVPVEFEGTERGALALSTAAVPAAEGCAFSAAIADGAKPSIAAYSAREADWKLVYEKKSGSFRLFDLRADPKEASDASERAPDIALDLTQRLLRHIRETQGGPERPRAVSSDVLRRLREKGYW